MPGAPRDCGRLDWEGRGSTPPIRAPGPPSALPRLPGALCIGGGAGAGAGILEARMCQGPRKGESQPPGGLLALVSVRGCRRSSSQPGEGRSLEGQPQRTPLWAKWALEVLCVLSPPAAPAYVSWSGAEGLEADQAPSTRLSLAEAWGRAALASAPTSRPWARASWAPADRPLFLDHSRQESRPASLQRRLGGRRCRKPQFTGSR